MTDTAHGLPNHPSFFEDRTEAWPLLPRRERIDGLNEFLGLFLAMTGEVETAGIRQDREVTLLILEVGRDLTIPPGVSAKESFRPRASSFVSPKHAAVFAVFTQLPGFAPELRPIPDSIPAKYRLVVSLS